MVNLLLKPSPETTREYFRKWYQRNKEKHNAKMAEWYQQNKEYWNQKSKEWQQANKERLNNQHKIYRKAHPIMYMESVRRCKIRRRGVTGHHTKKEWEKLKQTYDYTCLCCGEQEPNIKLTRDHIIPLIKKGSDNIENIQPLCKPCNSSKFTEIVDFRGLV